MPDEEVVVYGLDMDNPDNAAAVKEKWGKEHSTVLEPDHLAKSDLEARLAIQKGVPITNLAVPKNGVAAYLPAAGGGASGSSEDEYPKVLYADYFYNDGGYLIIAFSEQTNNISALSWDAMTAEESDEVIAAFLEEHPEYNNGGGITPIDTPPVV